MLNSTESFLPDESQVIDRLRRHIQEKSTDLRQVDHHWSSDIYTSESYFRKERALLLENFPLCLGPSQALEKKPIRIF